MVTRKQTFLLVIIIILAQGFGDLNAANYYWVGGSGNWSDLSHWSTSSGGNTFHVTIPGTGDNVNFDNNSFPSTGAQVVFNNEFAYVRELRINSSRSPRFSASDSTNVLVISRHAIFEGDFIWDYNGNIQLISNEAGNEINFANKKIGKNLLINGLGEWNFLGGFEVEKKMHFIQGSISFGPVNVKCGFFESNSYLPRKIAWNDCQFVVSKPSELYDPPSYSWDLNTYSFRIFTSQLITTALPGNTITFLSENADMVLYGNSDNVFKVGTISKTSPNGKFLLIDPNHFTTVESSADINLQSSANLFIDFRIRSLILAPKSVIAIAPDYEYSMASLDAKGSCLGSITFWSSASGTQSSISISNPTMGVFLNIRDILNKGVAMNVQDGADLGNNGGFNLASAVAKKYFWIGRHGQWSIGSNWSFTSGGGPSMCLPGVLDTVVFDSNSFAASGQYAQLEGDNTLCGTMRWEAGVRSGAGIRSSENQNLLVNGSLYFQAGMDNAIEGNIIFASAKLGNEIKSDGIQFKNKVSFSNASGSWKLLDNAEVIEEVVLNSGTLILDGNQLSTFRFNSRNNDKRTLDISNSQLIIKAYKTTHFYPSFFCSDDNFLIISNNSKVTFTHVRGSLDMYSQIYPKKNTLPLNFDKMEFIGLSNIASGDQNTQLTIKHLTLNSGGYIYTQTSITADSLFLGANHSYEFRKASASGDVGLNLKFLKVIENCSGIANLVALPYEKRIFFQLPGSSEVERIYSINIDYKSPSPVQALNSVDGGNNSNVTFATGQGRKLYYVNIDNNWSSRANWSKVSGGTGGECVPTILDTVIFDNQSFENLSVAVINAGSSFAYCKDFYFDVPGYMGYFSPGRLSVHGNISIKQKQNFQGTDLIASGTGHQKFDANGTFFANFLLQASDTVSLLSEFNVYYNSTFEYGTYYTHEFNTTTSIFQASPPGPNLLFLNLGSGTHTIIYDNVLGNGFSTFLHTQLDAGTSHIIFTGANISLSFHDEIEFHNLSFTATNGTVSMNIYQEGSGLKANKLFFASNLTIDITSSMPKLIELDTLIFSSGKTYSFDPDAVYKVNKQFQAIGNNCNAINFTSSVIDKNVNLTMPSTTELLMNFVQINGITASGGNQFNAGAYSLNVANSSIGWFFPDKSVVNESLGILGKDLSVCVGTDVTLNAGPFDNITTYLWNNNSTSNELNAVNSGNYSVLVTYKNNCQVKDTVSVQFNEIPAVDLGTDFEICKGTDKILTAIVAADSIIWNDGSRGDKFEVITSGEIILSAYNKGCVFMDTVMASVLEITTFDLGSDTILCGTEKLNLRIDPQIGETIVWNDNSTQNILGIDTTGLYYGTVDNGQCKYTDSIQVTYLRLAPGFLGEDMTICDGERGRFSFDSQFGDLTWSSGSNADTLIAEKAGKYWLFVKNASCIFRDTVELFVKPLPKTDLPMTGSICEGSSFQVTACCDLDMPIVWQDAAPQNSRTFTSAGTYYYEASNIGCTVNDSIVISEIILGSLDLGPDISQCIDKIKHLDAGIEGVSYLWSTGSTMKEINANESGIYFVTVAKEGCTKTDSINITYKALPNPGILETFTFCDGGGVEVLIPSANVDSVLWSDGNKMSSRTFSTVGAMRLTSYKNNCQSDKEISITQTTIEASLPVTEYSLCPGATEILTILNPASQELLWNTNEDTEEIEISSPGTYSVKVSEGLCSKTFDIFVEQASCQRFEMTFPNIISLSSFDNQVFGGTPVNPDFLKSYRLLVFDRYGNQIFYSEDPNATWDGHVSGKQVLSGVYTYLATVNYADDYVDNGELVITGTCTILP